MSDFPRDPGRALSKDAKSDNFLTTYSIKQKENCINSEKSRKYPHAQTHRSKRSTNNSAI